MAGRVEVRISEDDRRLGEAAAAALGVSLSEFVRQAARARAEEVLREKTSITLDDDAAARFLAVLDADAPPPEGLRELLARPTPWRT